MSSDICPDELKKRVEELEKENRVLKRKLNLSESRIERFEVLTTVHDKVESILNDSYQKELQYFQLVLENSTNILILLDYDGRFAYASHTFLRELEIANFGLISGSHFVEVLETHVSKHNLNILWDNILLSTERKETIYLELHIDFRYEQDQMIYNISVTPMLDDNQNCTGTMILFNDITVLNNALVNAKNANEAKSRFLATMSHEIRTPMNAIIGTAEIELSRGDIPTDVRYSFQIVHNSAQTLLQIINDILDLSKIESGKFELLPVEYETSSLINDTVQLNILRIGNKPIRFELKVSENLPKLVIGDDLRIKQILNNLLSNSIKYTKKGTVTFEIDTYEQFGVVYLVFGIRDTGIGMTPEQLAQIYDEYATFITTANRNTEGTGLGMNITRFLINEMGGKIYAESEVNVGSFFTVSIPQNKVNDEVIGAETAIKLSKHKFVYQKYALDFDREYIPYGKVLVVDDVEANLYVAEGLMKPYGMTIHTALSGSEAIEKIKENIEYDIIFMDHMMPEMDGIETTLRIREMGYKHPIIALTANAVIGQKELFLKNNFDDFLSKPIDIKRLNVVLNEFIRDRKPAEVVNQARRDKIALSKAAETQSETVTPLDPETEKIMMLENVESLDIKAALGDMGGSKKLYLKTIALFLDQLPKYTEALETSLNSEDIKAFMIKVHGLKSILRTIGATKLGHFAEILETHGKEENHKFCSVLFLPFKSSLQHLCKLISVALEGSHEHVTDEHYRENLESALNYGILSIEGNQNSFAIDTIDCCIQIANSNQDHTLLGDILTCIRENKIDTAKSLMNNIIQRHI
jgi:signal transduction histidine kinase/DNA-binding response OmpR family regulator